MTSSLLNLRSYGCSSVFDSDLWVTPLLEKTEEPLEVVQPNAHKITYSLIGDTNRVCEYNSYSPLGF